MVRPCKSFAHTHNDSKRNRHGPVPRAVGSTNRGESEGSGLNLGNSVVVTLVRLPGFAAQVHFRGPGYPFCFRFLSCAFVFYLFSC